MGAAPGRGSGGASRHVGYENDAGPHRDRKGKIPGDPGGLISEP